MRKVSLRVPISERLLVGVLALITTYAFFFAYLPPRKRVHVFSDIEGFHYPLQRYAFQSFKEGRFPQWDPSIYCGITFVGNTQAAILYPPSWLLYAVNWHYRRIPFKAIEQFAFAHIWLAFMLAYLWLRGRRLDALPSALGAGVFAFGGYMVSQIVHLGAVTGTTWMPLGLWGIDEAVDRRDWRPLWKTALASALCFLAGYPATWIVFCATNLLYALMSREHWRAAAGVCGALGASVLLAMAQWLPALEAGQYMVQAEKYGGGIEHWDALLTYFVPNWFDFNRHSPLPYPDAMYLYLGVSGIFAIGWAVRRGDIRPYWQPLIPAALCFILATNPHYLVYHLMKRIPPLERVAQSYNFYEGLAAMAALITALGLQDFLNRRPVKTLPAWTALAGLAALAAWSIREVRLSQHGGAFPTGGRALAQTALALLIFAIALWIYRAQGGRRRMLLAAALLLSVAIDYRAFGANRRFNTTDGDADQSEDPEGIRGISAVAYEALWNNRDHRAVSDQGAAPNSTDFRKWGIATPQGFDPFLPAQYHDTIERWVKFHTNRLFWVDLKNESMLQTLSVRYVISHEGVGHDAQLAADPNYRLVGEDDSFYRIYEYQHSRRPGRWANGVGDARPTLWLPERRVFRVQSDEGGRFVFGEQFYPGWSAKVDGRRTNIERWDGAFQAIQIPPGEHTVVFRYLSRFLLPGAVISLLALAGVALVIRSQPPRKKTPPLRWFEFRVALEGRLTRPDPDEIRF